MVLSSSLMVRVVLWVLIGLVFVLLLGILIGFGWPTRLAGTATEWSLLVAFGAAVILMIWMFLWCRQDPALSSRERNLWYLLLFIGGPITAAVYIHQRLGRTPDDP